MPISPIDQGVKDLLKVSFAASTVHFRGLSLELLHCLMVQTLDVMIEHPGHANNVVNVSRTSII